MTPLILKIKTDKNGVPTLSDAKEAIGTVESAGSGGYTAVGPRTKKGDRAYGKYQVMGANIPSWTKEVTGKAMTPQQFLDAPAVQDAVFNKHFGQAMEKYGNAQDAASVWFSGKPLSQAAGRRDVTGTSAEQYVNKFNNALGGSQSQPSSFGLPVTQVGDVIPLNSRRNLDQNLFGTEAAGKQTQPYSGGANPFGNVIDLTPERAQQAVDNVNRAKLSDTEKFNLAAAQQQQAKQPAPAAPESAAPVGQDNISWLRNPTAVALQMPARINSWLPKAPPLVRQAMAKRFGEMSAVSDPQQQASMIIELSNALKSMGY